MIRLITTSMGQIMADVNEEKKHTTFIDPKSLKPIASVNSIEYNEIVKAIRRVGSLSRLKRTLAAQGVEVFASVKPAPKKETKPSQVKETA